MRTPPRWLPHLRSALVFLFGAWMLILGTPGLDFLRASDLEDPEERAAAFRDFPDPLVWLGIGIVAFNREVRLPVVARIEGTQRPFRIAQTWNLYRNGPGKVRHMEVWIDGELRYRSQSEDHTWREGKLRSRRIRPMVESTCVGRRSRNWKGLTRWVVSMAREDFPDVKKVAIHCKQAPFPGTEGEDLSHRIEAEAPKWTPRMPR